MEEIVLGPVDTTNTATVRLLPNLHNPQITFEHEKTHHELLLSSTVGNIQQLLTYAYYLKGIQNDLKNEILRILNESIEKTRKLQEGCATYASIKTAQLNDYKGWREMKKALPSFYKDAEQSLGVTSRHSTQRRIGHVCR